MGTGRIRSCLQSGHAHGDMGIDTRVWASEPLDFKSRWRFYSSGRCLIGSACLDPKDSGPAPPADLVNNCHRQACQELGFPFFFDFGVTDGGQGVLIDLTDAMFVGPYALHLPPRKFLDFVTARWEALASNPGDSTGKGI